MTIQELRAELNRVANEMTELGKIEDWADDEREKFEKLNTASEDLEKRLVMAEKVERLSIPADATPVDMPEVPEPESRTYDEVFEKYVRHGTLEMEREDVKTLRAGYQVVGTDNLGGYTVPEGQMQIIEESMLAFGGLRSGPITVLRTADGRDLPFPTSNDTGNTGQFLAEATEETNTADIAVGELRLGAYKVSSKFVKLSAEFLRDTSIDAGAWVLRALAERNARALATQLIVGDGSTEPGGLDTAGSFVTAAGAAAITRTDILNLIHSVDPAYRRSPAFRLVMNDATVKAIKLLSVGSSDDRPLWVPSMRDGAPSTIEGVPYVVDIGVASIAASARSMYAGDLSKFIVRDAGPARLYRLEERYREFDATAFILFTAHDSGILDAGTDPIKYLRHPAS
jgi:HK97 family phage major capsid protein